MPRFLPDTSCMIPAICEWHTRHERAAAEINQRRSRGETMIVAGPALMETYSSLTRLPLPYRLSPPECLALIEGSFTDSVEVVGLAPAAYVALLRSAPLERVVGGRIYDAVIAACARVAGVETLLTFNQRHFAAFAGPGMEIVVPGAI